MIEPALLAKYDQALAETQDILWQFVEEYRKQIQNGIPESVAMSGLYYSLRDNAGIPATREILLVAIRSLANYEDHKTLSNDYHI